MLSEMKSIKPMLSGLEIRAIAERLARLMEADYSSSAYAKGCNKGPVLVGALKGAFLFLSDIVKELAIPVEVDFVRASCYGHRGEAPSAAPVIIHDVEMNLSGRDVILVEDIVDRGVTLEALSVHLMAKKPATFKVCTLLLREGTKVDADTVKYVGTTIAPGFVVGYGMDYKERYRELPGIYRLDDIKKAEAK